MTIRLTHVTLGADLRYGTGSLHDRPGWQRHHGDLFRLVRRLEHGWLRFQVLRPIPMQPPRDTYEHAEQLIWDVLLRFPAAESSRVTISRGVTITVTTAGLLVDPQPLLRAAGLVAQVRLTADSTYEWTVRREIDVLSPGFLDLARRVATVIAVLDQVVTAGDLVIESAKLLEAA